MRVLISAEGKHDPAGTTYMAVDNHGILLDLSKVRGTLVDPTILRVEWGPALRGGQPLEAGVITRQDSTAQIFYDQALLKPYLDAYNVEKTRLLQEQQAFDAEKATAAAP